MAPDIGLEPMTYRLEGGCSIPTELIGHMKISWRGVEPLNSHHLACVYNFTGCIATTHPIIFCRSGIDLIMKGPQSPVDFPVSSSGASYGLMSSK